MRVWYGGNDVSTKTAQLGALSLPTAEEHRTPGPRLSPLFPNTLFATAPSPKNILFGAYTSAQAPAEFGPWWDVHSDEPVKGQGVQRAVEHCRGLRRYVTPVVLWCTGHVRGHNI
eukprot:CAMPEP_0174371230 /NCGR_PEP_ID=MMETSP0811_2-20130205/99017_1 /TAXON_ID=73025 ORGANISM="Eutreptiella gymnastica-like, Strain CCMP1594" /NCGR_SAMPLE_ID=MMETSP0811_2 /ASSEMBLY_ACC=CAM_ASM_000667 /LENGTH=114 /DNA_ID=CAMNT_0015517425 /DNA_START=355 /DNA_END=700 /DNA_ORIENTATION=+